jgi:toxin ParE1/3/4
MSQYTISLPASRDLQAINDRFAVVNVEAGELFLLEFNRKCQQLVKFPRIGKVYEELSPGLRGIPLNGYIIFYKTIDDRIKIVRVVSGKRDLPSLFQDTESQK